MTISSSVPVTPELNAPYVAKEGRYQNFGYRRVGTSGLFLPPVSLGLWWNFGDDKPFQTQRDILRHAFDEGITHFDLANNYGPPAGSAEENFGRMMKKDFAPYRNELIISSKAGWRMWPGPYGDWGSKKYLTASCDEALDRMNLDYVDIFYSHRADPGTPVAETVAALDSLVRAGKALYVGVSSYSAERTAEAVAIAQELGTPLVIHQPSYSILNRWVEGGLLDVLNEKGLGSIAFTPLAQGFLTDRFLDNPDAPRGSRDTLPQVTEEGLEALRGLREIARDRGQTLAQMSVAWLLRDGGVTSVLMGASSIAQLDENLKGVQNTDFDPVELQKIDELASKDFGVNHLWAKSSSQ